MPPVGMAPPAAATPPALQPRTPSAEEFRAMVQQELTVKVVAEPGTKAEVVKRKGMPYLAPSGGFRDGDGLLTQL